MEKIKLQIIHLLYISIFWNYWNPSSKH